MHRNSIIAICVAVCAVAIIAGWAISAMSRTAGAVITSTATEAPGAGFSQTPGAIVPAPENATALSTPEAVPTSSLFVEPTPPVEATTAAEPTVAPAPTSAPAVGAAPASPAFTEYTVQKGDVLYTIAQNNHVTVEQILAINDIANPESLSVGQVIRIPKA